MTLTPKALSDERGESNIGTYLIIIVLVVGGLAAVKLIPIYYGFSEIGRIVDMVINNGPKDKLEKKSAEEIETDIWREMKLSGYEPDDIAEISVDKNSRWVEATVDIWFELNYYVGQKTFYRQIVAKRDL